MSIRIHLTGRVSIQLDGDVAIDERHLRGRQGRLVFAYLVAERSHPVPREELARVVWSDDLAPSWESALSALISRLAGLLSLSELKSRGMSLERGFGQLHLTLPTDVWVDIEACASSVDRAEAALRNGQTERVSGSATVALNIARRPFLSGVKGEWVESQQRKLERQLIRALDCVSEMWLASDDPGLAIETAIEAIQIDAYRERSHQLLMRAYSRSGNRARAVDAYHRLRELLATELGTEPTSETQSLYLELLG